LFTFNTLCVQEKENNKIEKNNTGEWAWWKGINYNLGRKRAENKTKRPVIKNLSLWMAGFIDGRNQGYYKGI